MTAGIVEHAWSEEVQAVPGQRPCRVGYLPVTSGASVDNVDKHRAPAMRFALGIAMGCVAVLALYGGSFAAKRLSTASLSAVMVKTEAPKLCSAEIVKEVCHALNMAEIHGTAADADNAVVHASELSEMLWATTGSIVEYLKAIGLKDIDPDAKDPEGGFAVSCQNLCDKTVASFNPAVLPHTIDVGCYYNSQHKVVCDIDFSDAAQDALSTAAMSDKTPEEEIEAYHEENSVFNHTEEPMDDGPVSQSVEDLKIAVVELFRIYPAEDTEDKEDLEFDGNHTEDEDKDDFRQGDQEGRRLKGRHLKGRRLATWVETAAWRGKQASMQAANALRLMGNGDTGLSSLVAKWFGRNTRSNRAEIKRQLNGLRSLLSRTGYYRYSDCPPTAIAFVVPGQKTNTGKYVYNLCKSYFQEGHTERVMTLLHEASHHPPCWTTDSPNSVCNNQKCYGTTNSLKLGRSCRGVDYCKWALRGNADSLSYFTIEAKR
jgi:hypothetical protein